MKLEIDGEAVDGPLDYKIIEDSIYSLVDGDSSFVILSRDELSYIQTRNIVGNGYALEYQEVTRDEHYICSKAHLSVEDIAKAFQSYFSEDEHWKKDFDWKKEGSGSFTGNFVADLVIGFVILLILGVIIWKLLNTT